jgi:hypothetical protein
MDADRSVTATFVEDDPGDPGDTTGPSVSDVAVAVSETSATVTWTTDEPASSSVAYGPTGAYEDGSVVAAALVTDHSVTLDALDPGTTYHYAITSADVSDNVTTTPDATFTTGSPTGGGDGPTIDVWYGDMQDAGVQAQRWANVLGNVSDPDGVTSLRYRLNGGQPQALSIGPDLRRLAMPGDFNVEIDGDDLVEGDNLVVLEAEDGDGATSTREVVLHHLPEGVLDLPYAVDWTAGGDPSQSAHIVDGLWEVSQGGVTTVEVGYDRTIAVGDMRWDDYEVEVPVTVRSLGPDAGTPQSGEPLVGLGLRWQGHTGAAQPRIGFYPTGAYVWHRWRASGRFELIGNDGLPLDKTGQTIAFDSTYVFKAQVRTTPAGDEYRFKCWELGQPEPAGWLLDIVEADGHASGAVLLIAHHVDATFGTVEVRPLP